MQLLQWQPTLTPLHASALLRSYQSAQENRLGGLDRREMRNQRLDLLELLDPFADSGGKGDDVLRLVADERVLPGNKSLIATARGCEHVTEVGQRIALLLQSIRRLQPLDGFARQPLRLGMFARG